MSSAKKIDSLFAWADDMYKAGRFDDVDRILGRLNVAKLSDALIYAWVCIAWWPVQAGRVMPTREAFHARVAEHWQDRREDLLMALHHPQACRGFFLR